MVELSNFKYRDNNFYFLINYVVTKILKDNLKS
jgi:hypothetical protein